ncbi:hypothetical protein QCD79_31755, partial [Pseudomonas quasicaspiana]|nr:hypothetical protein [Pseudomonas quasicaspiana]
PVFLVWLWWCEAFFAPFFFDTSANKTNFWNGDTRCPWSRAASITVPEIRFVSRCIKKERGKKSLTPPEPDQKNW